MMRSFLLAALFTLGALAIPPGLAPQAQAQSARLIGLDEFPRTKLEIHSSRGKHEFDVWVAVTPDQQAQGLMFVRDLPPERGMLFTAKPPRVFTMWMKNTYIPLDMVFIGPDGRIAKIVERTTPHSRDLVSSDAPASAILELKGGEAERRALRVGDRVTWNAPSG